MWNSVGMPRRRGQHRCLNYPLFDLNLGLRLGSWISVDAKDVAFQKRLEEFTMCRHP